MRGVSEERREKGGPENPEEEAPPAPATQSLVASARQKKLREYMRR